MIITWFGRLESLVLVWLGKTEPEMVRSLDSVLNWNFGTGYKTGPCFETRTGTKLGPEPELVFLQIMLLGKKSSIKSVRDI